MSVIASRSRAWASRIAERLGRAFDSAAPDRTDAWIALVVAAVALALACAQVFRRRAVPVLNDEFAYQLQARTLLHGRIALPPPAIPEFQ